MKEISYDGKMRKEVIVEEVYRGHKYVIIDGGMWPNAYVSVNTLSLEDAENISVHGGVTWKGEAHWEDNPYTLYVGWDYAHCFDYVAMPEDVTEDYDEGKQKHTIEEIISHCKSAIDQLILFGDAE